MAYLGTQPNDVKKNIGLYTPSDIHQLTIDGSWGGSLEFIMENSFSTSSAVELTTLKENVYDVHYFTLILTGSHQDHRIDMSFSNDGGTSYENSNYEYAKIYGQTDGTFNQQTSTAASGMQIGANVDSNDGFNAYGYLYNLGDASKFSFYSGHSIGEKAGDAGVQKMEFGGGCYQATETVNAFKFAPNVGTLTGECKLYGIKKI